MGFCVLIYNSWVCFLFEFSDLIVYEWVCWDCVCDLEFGGGWFLWCLVGLICDCWFGCFNLLVTWLLGSDFVADCYVYWHLCINFGDTLFRVLILCVVRCSCLWVLCFVWLLLYVGWLCYQWFVCLLFTWVVCLVLRVCLVGACYLFVVLLRFASLLPCLDCICSAYCLALSLGFVILCVWLVVDCCMGWVVVLLL